MHPGPNPVEFIERILHYWWVLVVCMIIGGSVGWGITFSLPRIYQAQAKIGVYIDFSLVGPLTDVEEDMAVVAIGDVIKSSDVISQVVEKAQANNIEITSSSFWKNAFLEREGDRWKLIIRDRDAQRAAVITEIWTEVSLRTLQEAYGHATKAEELQRYRDSLISCLEQIILTVPAYSFCKLDNLEEIQNEIQQTEGQLTTEKLAGKGILSASSFNLVQKAEAPSEPFVFGRGSLALSGSIIGLLIALILIPSLELFINKRNNS
jgi:hypothetical protein